MGDEVKKESDDHSSLDGVNEMRRANTVARYFLGLFFCLFQFCD